MAAAVRPEREPVVRSGSGAAGPTERRSAGARRWSAAAAGGAGVAAVVVAVYAVAGGDPSNDASPGAGAGVAPVATSPADAPAPESPAAESPAAGVELFGAEAGPADVERTTAADVSGAWPVAGCLSPVAVEAGRIDFVSGTERGPEYRRDLAIGWYVDEAAAAAGYDAVVARIAACAADAGAQVTTDAADVGEAGSLAVVSPGGTTGAESGPLATSLAAVSRTGAVVVLAVDHAGFYGAPAAESTAGTTAQADRLLADACEAAPDRC